MYLKGIEVSLSIAPNHQFAIELAMAQWFLRIYYNSEFILAYVPRFLATVGPYCGKRTDWLGMWQV